MKSGRDGSGYGNARVSLIALGLLSILGQVVLLREVAVAFYGVELAYLLGLGVWLAWGAVGAALARSGSAVLRRADVFFLLFAAALPVEVAFLRGLRPLLSAVSGAYLPFPQQMAALVAALAPAGMFLGLLFPAAAVPFVRSGRSLAAAYAWESAGGAAGGLVATLSLRLGVQNFTLAAGCALAAVAASRAAGGGRGASLPAVLLAVLLLTVAVAAPALDRRMTRWSHPHLVESADSPYGRVTVSRSAGQIAVFENDALSFESESTDAEAFVHLAALQAPDAPRALVLGGGGEGLVKEVLLHAPRSIEYVELNPVLHRVATPYLPQDLRSSFEAGNVRVVFDDPRRFLETGTVYDLLLVGMPEPASGQANRFYTREFFTRCAARLSPAGVLALRLPSAENFRTPQNIRRSVSIYRALRDAFSDVLLLPGTVDVVLAGKGRLIREPSTLASRLLARGIRSRLVTPQYLDYVYTNDRFSEMSHVMETWNAPANTDARPVSFHYTAMIWLSKFFPALARTEVNVGPGWVWAGGFGVMAGCLLCRRRPAWRMAALAGLAGFAGMVLESVVLLHYQAKSGVLFQDLSVLLTSFMIGLAGGAAGFGRVMGRAGRGGRVGRRWACAVILAFCLLSVWSARAAAGGSPAALAPLAALLAVTGALVAALFAYASRFDAGDQGRAASPLYAADLLGGCVGALAASLLLIPLAGLPATAYVAAAACAGAFLLI